MKPKLLAIVAALSAWMSIGGGHARATTYNVQGATGAYGADFVNLPSIPWGSFGGSITTDGTRGVLSASNIVSFAVTLGMVSPIVTSVGFSSLGGQVVVNGTALTATPRGLFFNFDQPNSFVEFIRDPSDFFCLSTEISACSGYSMGVSTFTDGQVGGSLANIYGFFPSSPNILEIAGTTPIPAALPLFATGLGGLGLLGWRRKRKQAVA